MTPSRFTSIKVAFGYTLLLAVLVFSLLFVHREIEKISASDYRQELFTDSILVLLREKDQNTLRILHTLSNLNDSMMATHIVEKVVSEQDSVIAQPHPQQQIQQQHIQQRVITRRDSVLTPKTKKKFFKRLAEAFNPPADSAILLKTSTELATDTIIECITPIVKTDSTQIRQEAENEKKIERRRIILKRQKLLFTRKNAQLNERIDSLIKRYEKAEGIKVRKMIETSAQVRERSTVTLGWISGGAILLSALFLTLSWRDISRSNRYRRKLEEANRRAAELLDTREKLMLTITHDFKAPLGSIMGYTDLLSRLTSDEREKFYLENMKSSSRHLLKLVTDLLDFHRLDLQKEEVNRIAFNPMHLFEEIVVSFKPLTATKNLFLRYDIKPEMNARFISDPLRIRQIVNNLLSNAVKFTTEGGISLRVGYEKSCMLIEVEDTGQGMDADEIKHIYQEFTRLSSARGEEGFGLGLSIVKKLVVLLEGSIEVESEPQKGSLFLVRIPLYPWGGSLEAAQAVVREANPAQNHLQMPPEDRLPKTDQPEGTLHKSGKPHILMIDDDKIQLQLTAAMLQQHQLESVSCTQIEELTEQLHSAEFDVLLTDVQMPSINGFDLVRLLRASNIPQARTIPIIAVTARSDMDENEFIKHGFAGCLFKPFNMTELCNKLKTLSINCHNHPDHASPTASQQEETSGAVSYKFEALTAFSDDDPKAAYEIISSFIESNRQNRQLLEEASQQKNSEKIAAIAHKMLPLFRLIDAREAVSLLVKMEQNKETEFNSETVQNVTNLLILTEEVTQAATDFLGNMHYNA